MDFADGSSLWYAGREDDLIFELEHLPHSNYWAVAIVLMSFCLDGNKRSWGFVLMSSSPLGG